MSTYQCSKGHTSTEPDYCSECGVKIQITPQSTVETLHVTSLQTITCPDCTAPHNPNNGNFCEICGYNFATKAHGEVPPVSQGNRGAISSPPPSLPTLEITAIIDPSLASLESPAPPNQPPMTFRLDKETNLIGRLSEIRGVYPEVALDFDDAVSHRHALLTRQADGTFVLRDIGSTNGTTLNGVELIPMVDVPIKDGDEFTLGHWTRIKVKVE